MIKSNFKILQGSNDSNYSGPSSGGDISYEETDKYKISNLNAVGGGSGSAGNLGATTAANRQQQQRIDNKNQQRNQDAKHELELCRVRFLFLFNN